jgi:hypothetical protein
VNQAFMKNKATPSRKALYWLAFLAIVLVGIGVVVAPVWIIQPFRPQVSRDLSLSYELRRWSPQFTLFASAVAIGLVVWLWTGARWFSRVALIVIIVPLLVCTWFARQNHFEWMFNGLHNPAYAKVAEVDFVDNTDMVMTVELNGESAAYPIRQMAYHHIVQDTVGGTPIVSTY